jgi:hypothetical protein
LHNGDYGLATIPSAASFPCEVSDNWVLAFIKENNHTLNNTMKIAKLAIAAAAVSLLAASCCPSSAPAPAPAPVQSSK